VRLRKVELDAATRYRSAKRRTASDA